RAGRWVLPHRPARRVAGDSVHSARARLLGRCPGRPDRGARRGPHPHHLGPRSAHRNRTKDGASPCATLNHRSAWTPPCRRQRSSQTRARVTCWWCARVRPAPARATMTEPIVLTPIGVVRGGRSHIYEDHWGAVVARLLLDPAV